MSSSTLLLLLPAVTAVLCLVMPQSGARGAAYVVALLGAMATLALTVQMAVGFDPLGGEQYITRVAWIPEIGISFHLGVDGLSVPMLVLTALLTVVGVIAVPLTMARSGRAFYTWFLLLEAAVLGVFLARDWFLFYLFWELALIPMFFMIGLWGGPKRAQAAYSFFLYTLAGSMVMLVGLMAAYLQSGSAGFEKEAIAAAMRAAPEPLQMFVMVCVLIGMAVKLPAVPLHGWLPGAHVEAPVPASIILSGILLKMGGYGLMRVVEMTPAAVEAASLPLALVALISIVYGAAAAFRQDDLKALIAYSSISHMGFVLLGVAALSTLGLRGAMMQMISHGLITAALFFLAGLIYAQTHSRSLLRSSGLVSAAPRFRFVLVVSLLAAMGLPGLSGFVGEFQVLVGGFERHGIVVAIAGIGVVLTAAYALRVTGRLMIAPRLAEAVPLRDLGAASLIALIPLVALMVWIGLSPGWLGDVLAAPLLNLVAR